MVDYLNFSEYFNEPKLKAGISLRSLTGDVKQLRSKLAYKLMLKDNGLCNPIQIHSNSVDFVDEKLSNKKTDGLVSANKDLVLSISAADCIPLFLFERKNKFTGLIHSGWRGTVGNIAVNGISIIKNNGGCSDNIEALIGPSICKDHFIVREDIISQFPIEYVTKRENSFFNVDLKQMIINQLISQGLNIRNIYNSDLCTFCRKDLFFSYRRDGGLKGQMIAMIGWSK